MEDNRDDMKEFFRKKLNQQEELSDGWDKPSPGVFNNALLNMGLAELSPRPKMFHRLAYACLPALLFFAAYSVYLNLKLWSIGSENNTIESVQENNELQSIEILKNEIALLKSDLKNAEERIHACNSEKKAELSTQLKAPALATAYNDANKRDHTTSTALVASPPARKDSSIPSSQNKGSQTKELFEKERKSTSAIKDSALKLIPPLKSDIPGLIIDNSNTLSHTEPIFIKSNKFKKRKRPDYLLGIEYGQTRINEIFTTEIIQTEQEYKLLWGIGKGNKTDLLCKVLPPQKWPCTFPPPLQEPEEVNVVKETHNT